MHVVATIKAKPESAELVEAELLKFIEPTRQEEGCIQYELHRDNNNPATFVFYEEWTSKDLLEKHLQSAHLTAGLAAMNGHLEGVEILEVTKY